MVLEPELDEPELDGVLGVLLEGLLDGVLLEPDEDPDMPEEPDELPEVPPLAPLDDPDLLKYASHSVRDTWPSLFLSTLENVGAEALAPEAAELLGELDELELGELDEPELEPEAAGEDDDDDLSADAPLEDEPAAIALAANNAAMTATLVLSIWMTP